MDHFKNQQVQQLPDVSVLDFKKIHKAYLKVILLTTIVVACIAFVGVYFLIEYKLQEEIPNYTVYIYLGVAVLFLSIFSYLIVGFSRRKYVVRDRDITYKSGVLIKTMTTVPFSRIQHVEINEAPISRLFSLASLNVFTAGDSSRDLVIKGIKKEEALKIKEFINQQINE
ncbi:MAG: PH domain-containing protein [Flavobacteriaceae bacterium]|nr:PH domain-containing protein [Flavobacteriaceae bacterium]